MLSDRRRATLAALATVVLAALVLAVGPAAPPARAADALVGTFRITPGKCDGGASGSYFRMILPSGNLQGPWVDNGDSSCGDHSYTLLTPGTDGGLVTGSHQPAPTPGFDGNGNSLAVKVIRPVAFFGVNFAASTNATDLQTGGPTPAPTLQADGGRLSGDLSAFDATWNKQSFNQGSPKPDGSRPGNTTPVTGTYDAATGAYTLDWTSQIVGGPFNNFTGYWHLEGTFVPAGGSAPAPSGSPGTTRVAAAPTASADGGAAVTTPADELASPAAPEGAGEQTDTQAASAVRVDDEAFEAPVWLVVLLAAVGIAGVISLLVLGRRPTLEGTPSS
jgi:hypothetical protein